MLASKIMLMLSEIFVVSVTSFPIVCTPHQLCTVQQPTAKTNPQTSPQQCCTAIAATPTPLESTQTSTICMEEDSSGDEEYHTPPMSPSSLHQQSTHEQFPCTTTHPLSPSNQLPAGPLREEGKY